MPEIARMAASLVACLARPNGAPHFLPCERFRAFACAFHLETDPRGGCRGPAPRPKPREPLSIQGVRPGRSWPPKIRPARARPSRETAA
ncbi:hypothetical protein DF049_32475 [Burkholderia cenocepacia]|nr:hypothetical protein C6P63_10595 [Burkholderia cenocepacia]RQU69210.1 hypothetical protein DF049_32475 [Burkholderia cenocepacia]RQU95484.1 hypothetical protein DF042_30695 [Burkholderia cenocepacia]